MCELIESLNCTSTSGISNQFVFRNIQFKVTYFEALSEGVFLMKVLPCLAQESYSGE